MTRASTHISGRTLITLLAVGVACAFFLHTKVSFAHDEIAAVGASATTTRAPKPVPVRATTTAGTRAASTSAAKTLTISLIRSTDMVVKNALSRLNAAVDRLINISNRIGTRIDKLSADGLDMTQAKSLHAVAKTKIDAAKAKIVLIVKPIPPTDPTAGGVRDAYRAAFEVLRGQVHDADDAIREARRALEAVLKEIRRVAGSRADINSGATTTPPGSSN